MVIPCEKCEGYGNKKVIEDNSNKTYYLCKLDDQFHPEDEYCHQYTLKKDWYPDLFVISKKVSESKSGKSMHFRILTKLQLKYVVAGGSTVDICVPKSQYHIVTKQRKDYLQVTKWYYGQEKHIFEVLMTFDEQQLLKREELKIPALSSFFKQNQTKGKEVGSCE